MNRSVFFINHTSGQFGTLDIIESYFSKHDYDILRLDHPLNDYSKIATTLNYRGSKRYTISRRMLGIFNYVGDFYLSVKFITKNKQDVFVATNNFDTLPAIFCRKVLRKKINKIIYYGLDFSGKRFGNPILNKVYEVSERIAIRFADLTISNTNRSQDKRITMGLSKPKSMIIPNGVQIEEPKFSPKNISKNSFIYVGDVSKEHGLVDLIETMGPIIKYLVIIGSGDDLARAIKVAKTMKIKLNSFGPKEHDFVIKYLQNFNGFGLAPYNAESEWTYYCSPLKVGEYISCGVPVIMSDRPEVAAYVQGEGYGIAFHEFSLIDISPLLDRFDTRNYCERSRRFYDQHNVEVLLDGLLNEV